MSRHYREPRLSSDDERQLKALVSNSSSGNLVALIQLQQKKLPVPGAKDRGLFETAANALEVTVRSKGLAPAQKVFLESLIRQYGIEAVTKFIQREEQLRHIVQDTVLRVMNLNEGAEKYQGQYDTAIKSLEAFGIDHKDAPTWNDIAARLTAKKLALIEKLEGAQLILVPPKSRQDLVKAFNSQVGEHGIKHKAFLYRFEDDALWNNGKPESLKWEVVFVDGRQDLPYNEKLQAGKTAHEQVKALKSLHEKDGLGTLVGARAYLSLMMQCQVAKTPIDQKYRTVLNAAVVVKDGNALLSCAYWDFDRVCLAYGLPDVENDLLRLRAAVRV